MYRFYPCTNNFVGGDGRGGGCRIFYPTSVAAVQLYLAHFTARERESLTP